MPTARDLRERIRVDRRSQTPTARGGQGDWETLIDSRRASLKPRPIGGDESVLAARVQGTAMFDCWVRYDSDTATIRPDDRVVDLRDTSRVFNVRFAQDMDGRRTWILMQLELGVAEG